MNGGALIRRTNQYHDEASLTSLANIGLTGAGQYDNSENPRPFFMEAYSKPIHTALRSARRSVQILYPHSWDAV
jgi:hypothetical protein